ncbi:DUF3043 domain-containing protein [Gulosibacter sp. ACHW.36C]|uniref:DUF3043 domain-containing protein n=1 Tax=Gulosibacter sediminis TaxID=1729695 RepID=A0ABY4MTY3_9MICO|nr:DUF3043 domain-containing protein [Gulosibacter sediminis]UQN13877.1 DUF3043 domain-containing protein [Gulosibacter sediminis]
MAKNSASEQNVPESSDEAGLTSGKKGPTPRRRDAEAANFRPLVPEDRKEAKRQSRAKMQVEQQKAREGMARGDDRYLRPNERGPQKRYLRDFIDARITLGEWLLPLMFLVIFATFIPQTNAAVWAMMFIWIYLALCVAEGLLYGAMIRRKVREVVGDDKTEKGFLFQAMGRSMQIRMLRMPKPQVKRFDKIEFTGR